MEMDMVDAIVRPQMETKPVGLDQFGIVAELIQDGDAHVPHLGQHGGVLDIGGCFDVLLGAD